MAHLASVGFYQLCTISKPGCGLFRANHRYWIAQIIDIAYTE